MSATPRLWMIAGPNGSGKSTLYRDNRIVENGAPLWIINPDLLTTEIAERERIEWLEANAVALDRIMIWLQASLDVYQSIGFETVLSSPKYFDFIDRALEAGFEFNLIYVALDRPELHLERIRRRVAAGGHDVDPQKVIARRLRSFDNLAKVLPKTTFAEIYDNSGSDPTLLFRKSGDALTALAPHIIPEITERLRSLAQ